MSLPFAVGLTCRNNILPVYSALLNLKNPFFLLDGESRVHFVSNKLVSELNELSGGSPGTIYKFCDIVGMSFGKLMALFGFCEFELKEVMDKFKNQGEINSTHQVLGRKTNGRRYGFICSQNPASLTDPNLPAQGMFSLKDDLSQKDQATVMVLAKAAESKDKDTGGHILRMRNNCRMLGLELGLSEDELEILDYGSILHDVGKIAIEDRILNKPAKLDAEEWEIMKTHAAKGGEILRNGGEPLFAKVAVIPEQHHENYDGSGYPARLKGDRISLPAKIVAVVDTFDALSSKRSYKESFSVERVYDELESLRGKKLDPHVLDAFYGCLKRTKSVWRELILKKNVVPVASLAHRNPV